ncbi:MAG: MFS transporter [Chloroflexi bacterium]|nr:MFS transporter [Chloroflexota bacterium]
MNDSLSGRLGGVSAAEAALYLMAFLLQLGMGIMAPVLPEVKDTFGVSTAAVSLTISAYGFARLALDLPAGVFVERLPPFRLFLAGTAIISLGALLGSLATRFELVILARAVMGAGSALCMLTSQYNLSRLSTAENRGRVLGYYQAAMLAGSSFSPAIGGAIAVVAGWRSSFAFCAFTALLAFLSVVLTQRRPLAVSAGQAVRAVRQAGAQTTAPGLLANLLVINCITFAMFFHTSGFVNTFVPLFGDTRFGLDAAAIGLAISLGTVVRFFTSVVGGNLSDRFGRRRVLLPGLALTGTGVLLFSQTGGLTLYLAGIVVMAMGRFGNSLPTTLIIDQTPPRLWGRTLGINRFTGDLGAVLGPLALGWVIDHFELGAAVYVTGALIWIVTVLALVALREAPRGRAAVAGPD